MGASIPRRNRRSHLPAFLAVLAVLVIAPEASSQLMRQENAEISEAVLAAKPLVRGDTIRAALALQIGPGLHVNANPPAYDYLIPVSVSLRGPEGVEISQTFYPEPQHETFPYADDPLAVYEGTPVIGLELLVTQDAPLGPTGLQITVRYQACNDRACFAPANATAEVPVRIAAAGTPSEEVDAELLRKAPFPES